MNQKKSLKLWLIPSLFLGLVWAVLTKGSLISWSVGLPAIFIAQWAIHPLPRLKPFKVLKKGILPFLAYFFTHSFLAGIDVAIRIFSPSCPLSPGLIRYKFKLEDEIPKIFFCHVVSLMPGTLSAHLEDNEVLIHLLDKAMPNEKNLKKLEEKIACLFAEGVSS